MKKLVVGTKVNNSALTRSLLHAIDAFGADSVAMHNCRLSVDPESSPPLPPRTHDSDRISMRRGGASSQPTRTPGAQILEKVPAETTWPTGGGGATPGAAAGGSSRS